MNGQIVSRRAGRSLLFAAVLIGLVFSGSVVFAQALQVSSGASAKKVPWRGSSITYLTTVAVRSFIKSAEQSHDPYYGMSLMIVPRWWFTDHLYARMLMFLDIELTQGNNTNGSRRFTMSDTFFDWAWSDKRLTIPGIKFRVTPSLRFLLPTSSFTYNRNLIIGIGPGIGMGRGFKLRKGKWFSSASFGYGFRVVKEFHRFNTVSLNNIQGCGFSAASGPQIAACAQTGGRNRSWRILNAVSGSLRIHPKWNLSATAFFINDILYGMKASESANNPSLGEVVPEAGTFSRPASLWAMLSLTYTAANWAYIGLGVQSFHSIRKPDSTIRQPLFNRATSVYLSFTVPIQQAIDAVSGGDKKKKKVVRKDQSRPQS